MRYTAALDISTFIWCKEDYTKNAEHYYQLLRFVPVVFEQLQKLRLPILMRNELFEVISADFPYAYLSEIGLSDHSTKILRFLTTTKWNNYEVTGESDLITIPEIIRRHFNQELKEECNHQAVHLFRNLSEHKFIAYMHFFNQDNNLVLQKHDKRVEVDTLRYCSEEEIICFFERYKIKFKHNPKHNKYKSGGSVSPLSCYNERFGDATKAQRLLENSEEVGDDYYCLDEENNVYVRFVSSNDGTYHGYDISDERDNVPAKIKSKYNRNGKVFS